MRNRNDVLHALQRSDLHDVTARLIVCADYRELANPRAAVMRAIYEAAHGRHRHLYGLNLPLFDFLALVLEDAPKTEERKAKTDATALLPAVSGRRED